MKPETQTNTTNYVAAPSPGYERAVDFEWWLSKHGFEECDLAQTIAHRTTALMHAARHAASEIARELLVRRASVDARNVDGNNALWFACYSGDLTIVDMLCAAGIDLDNRNDGGITCLMYAASAGKAEVVARLLLHRADASLRSPDDFTALDMAASFECLSLLRAHSKASAR